MPELLDIAIIGAGAAGLMAAIFAGRTAREAAKPLRIAALDGAAKLGAKILVAGGGRCNVTHDVVFPEDFAGGNRNQIAKVLRTFSVEVTTAFFADLGVTLKREETGKLFPTTDRAQTVLDALLRATADSGSELWTDHRVTGVSRIDRGFAIETSRGAFESRHIVLASGGKSLPKTGSDGLGYELAKSLGHTVTDTTPALVPLVLEDHHWLTQLSGIAVDCELVLAASTGKVMHRQRGAMLFTHFGISGPAAMDISRHWIAAKQTDSGATLVANLFPGEDFSDVDRRVLAATSERPRVTVATLLRPWFVERLAVGLAQHAAGIPRDLIATRLGKDHRRALVHALTALPLPVVRDRGYLFAEVTAGGVPLDEIDLSTMQSRRCPGLFLCGEILNVDGRIGGYNFQWAWCTGRLAGMNAARGLTRDGG